MSSRRHQVHALLLALVGSTLSVALALAAAWPLPLHLSSAVVGEKMGMAWTLGVWMTGLPLSELWHANLDWLNFPDGGPVVLVALPQMMLARLFLPVLGPTAAVNLSLLLHLAAGVGVTARLAWTLQPAPRESAALSAAAVAAAAAVGAVVGLSCGMLSVLGNGQPENLGLAYLSLAVLGLVRLVRDGRLGWGALLLGLGTALAFVSSPYLLMGPLLAAPIVALPRLREQPQRLLLAASVVGLVCLPLGLHYSATTASQDDSLLCPASLSPATSSVLPLSRVAGALSGPPPLGPELLVADPARLLRPGRRGGGKDHLPVDYLGFLPVLAAGLAAVRERRSRWLLLGFLAVLGLSLGPALVFNGWWLSSSSGGLLGLPLGTLQALPGVGDLLGTIQVPVRLLLGAVLLLGLAGLPTWRALGERVLRLPGGRLWLVMLALSPAAEQLLLGPSGPPQTLVWTAPRAAQLALAQQADQRALLETPSVGWDPQRASYAGPPGGPIPAPVQQQRQLVMGHVVHGRPLAQVGCYRDGMVTPAVATSAFYSDVRAVLLGQGAGHDLGAAAAPLVDMGFGWYAIYTGTGAIRPQAEARLVAAAQQDLELVAEGADGSYLFRLPGWSQ